MKTLAIIASHPIQYYAPIYRTLAGFDDLRVTVFYDRIPTPEEQGEGFDTPFQWDVDLLGGYEHRMGKAGEQEFFKGLDERRWNAVMLHGWHDGWSRRALWRAWRHRTPLLVRGDNHLRTPRSLVRRVMRAAVCGILLPRFSACLAVGSWSAEFYRHFGVPEERMVASPHCVDGDFFQKQAARWAPERPTLRAAWGLPSNRRVFLFAGKIISEKRVVDFLKALARCQWKGLPVHGLVVGDGPLRGEMERLACSLGVEAFFAGFLNQSEMARAYVAADALVLPSESETWGLVVNEALACGVPCVVSDRVGCAVDMIVTGINGAVYPCGDVEALAGRMEEVAGGRGIVPPSNSQWKAVLEKHSCLRAADGIREAVLRNNMPCNDPGSQFKGSRFNG